MVSYRYYIDGYGALLHLGGRAWGERHPVAGSGDGEDGTQVSPQIDEVGAGGGWRDAEVVLCTGPPLRRYRGGT